MTTLVAGIDAGGTSIRVQWADAATGAPVGAPVCIAATAGGEPPAFDTAYPAVSVCAAVAKYTRPGVVAAWEALLRTRFPGATVRIVPDYVAAFHAGVPEGVGVCVVAGTGSVAYGENLDAQAVRVGGRGWEWGDEGSGAWLAAEMVRRTLRALDSQAPVTALTEAVCAELGTTAPAVLAQTARERAAETGRGFLLPLLVRLHESGNAEARGLIVGAGGWLASLGTAAARRLALAPSGAVTFAAAGGVWIAGGDTLAEAFALAVRRHFPGATFRFGVPAPVIGAVHLARKTKETGTESV